MIKIPHYYSNEYQHFCITLPLSIIQNCFCHTLLYEYMIPFFTAVKSFFTPFINVWNSGISYFCAVLIHSSNFAAFFENITLQKSLVNVYSSLNNGYFLILPDTILQWLFLYPQVFYKSAGTKLSFAHIQNAASPFPSVHAFMFFLFV